MDRFQLTDDLLTGMDDIDAQHRMLFELANQALEASPSEPNAPFFAALAFLAEYVNYHFAAEELAMKQAAYPARDQHVMWHTEFRDLVAELVELALEEADISALRQRLKKAIGGWLTQHIRVADKALAAHLRSCAGAETLPDEEALIRAGVLERRTPAARPGPKSTEP